MVKCAMIDLFISSTQGFLSIIAIGMIFRVGWELSGKLLKSFKVIDE
jgi:hypothetical protein